MRAWPLALLALLAAAALVWNARRHEPARIVAEAPTAEPQPRVDPPRETARSRPELPKRANVSNDAVVVGLSWLAARQNEDGSWGASDEAVDGRLYGRGAATALSVLAFLGAGYSHLSKDTYDGRVFGETVRRGLEWLKNNPPADPLGAALHALALSEAYGLTASDRWKGAAQAALDRIAGMQRDNGSWAEDPFVSAWCAEALMSARLSGLEHSAETGNRAGAYFRDELQNRRDALSAVGYIMTARDAGHPDLVTAKNLMVSIPPHPDRQDFAYWYMGSIAMFQLDGPRGPGWMVWNDALKKAVLPYKAPDASTASIVKTALAQLTLEIYYRYANVFK